MTQITAVNSTDQSAQLTILKGGDERTQALSGKVDVAAEGVMIVPPVKGYTVSASVAIDGNTYTTNTVHLPDGAWRLTARLEAGDGVFFFELASQPGDVPDRLVLINTLREPVLFTITAYAADAPGQAVLSSDLVVQPTERLDVGTGNSFAFYAVVDGVVTNTVEVDPGRPGQDVTLQMVQAVTDDGQEGYGLTLVEPAA